MRVAFLGNDPWSVPALEALAGSSHEVALVVTRVPRPAGRGGKLRPTRVADTARSLGLPLAEVETVKKSEGFDALSAARADVLVVVAYGEILPAAVLSLATPVNLHFSLLPALRGADPVRRAILEGHELTGVSTMLMDEGMDTGPILLQRETPISDEEDAGSLGARLSREGADLLVQTLDRLPELEPTAQPEEGASLAPKLRAEDEWIDWADPADKVIRRIRALSPDPGARTRFRGKLLKVLSASLAQEDGEPGRVLEVTKDGFTVAAGGSSLSIEAVVPEGRRPISGAEFARGYRPDPGETLG